MIWSGPVNCEGTQGFDPGSADFLADPYPTLSALRENSPVFYHQQLGRWFVTRHQEVRACLRDRRLGRNFRHLDRDADFAAPPLDPRWPAFWEVERHSLLWIEPPEHSRIRKLVAAAFTPRSVARLRAPAQKLAHRLLDEAQPKGGLELLAEYAQPLSL